MSKQPYKFLVYVPYDKAEIVKEFIEAVKARNESASSKIISYIEEVMKEGKINPQKRLLAYKKDRRCKCGSDPVYRARNKVNLILYLCQACFKHFNRKDLQSWKKL